jgi:hypothetical protein
MIQGWTLLVVCTSNIHNVHIQKILMQFTAMFQWLLDLPNKKVPILTDLIKNGLEYCIFYTVSNILFNTRYIWIDGSKIYVFIYFYSNYLQYIYISQQ